MLQSIFPTWRVAGVRVTHQPRSQMAVNLDFVKSGELVVCAALAVASDVLGVQLEHQGTCALWLGLNTTPDLHNLEQLLCHLRGRVVDHIQQVGPCPHSQLQLLSSHALGLVQLLLGVVLPGLHLVIWVLKPFSAWRLFHILCSQKVQHKAIFSFQTSYRTAASQSCKDNQKDPTRACKAPMAS